MMPYKAQVSNASRLGATRIAVPFERNRRVLGLVVLFGFDPALEGCKGMP